MESKWKTATTTFIIAGLVKVRVGSATSQVTVCRGGVSPTITIQCPGSSITIIKGVCVMVPSCNAYDPSLESQCDDSDKTAQWAAYCKTANPCTITGSCSTGSTCTGDTTYIYATYECTSSDEASTGPTMTSEPLSQPPVSDPASSQVNVVRQKSSLFRRILGRRLMNHVIDTKRGLSLVICGAACNNLDDCVSFNIWDGVCELNNQVVGGADVDFMDVEGCRYFEKH